MFFLFGYTKRSSTIQAIQGVFNTANYTINSEKSLEIFVVILVVINQSEVSS